MIFKVSCCLTHLTGTVVESLSVSGTTKRETLKKTSENKQLIEKEHRHRLYNKKMTASKTNDAYGHICIIARNTMID